MEDPLGLPGNDPGLRGERALPIPVIQLLPRADVALRAGRDRRDRQVEALLLARRFFRWE